MKNHARIRELLPLYATDELSPEEQQLVAKHLASCAACRTELEGLRAFGTFLEVHPARDISEEILREARTELHRRLRLEPQPLSFRRFFDGVTDRLTRPLFAIPAGAVTLLGIGIVIGAWFLPSERVAPPASGGEQIGGTSGSFQRGEIRTSNIRLHNLGRGEIEMSFDAVTPMTVRGDINDEQVQRVMARALTNEDNAGVRLRTVSALAEGADSIQNPDPQIKAALIAALTHDDNPGVRKDALRVLSRCAFDNEIKNAMLFALLHDSNAGLRVAAINALDLTKDEARLRDNDILKVLRRKVNDDNNYVRLHARTALQEIPQ